MPAAASEQVEVWDDLRGIYLVLTPEEWVRRHLIAYLVSHCGVLPKRIVQEYAVPVNGQPQRADVVVVGDGAEPLVLAECKARRYGSTNGPLRRPCVTIRCWGRSSSF